MAQLLLEQDHSLLFLLLLLVLQRYWLGSSALPWRWPQHFSGFFCRVISSAQASRYPLIVAGAVTSGWTLLDDCAHSAGLRNLGCVGRYWVRILGAFCVGLRISVYQNRAPNGPNGIAQRSPYCIRSGASWCTSIFFLLVPFFSCHSISLVQSLVLLFLSRLLFCSLPPFF